MLIRTLVVSFILCLVGCGAMGADDCGNEVKSAVKSPDGKYVATWYVRDCGATTDFSTIVNVRDSSAPFDADRLGVFIVEGQPSVRITWEGPRELRVACPDCNKERIFRQDTLWKDVTVSY